MSHPSAPPARSQTSRPPRVASCLNEHSAELDDLVLSRHRTTLKLAWEAELREDLEAFDGDAAHNLERGGLDR